MHRNLFAIVVPVLLVCAGVLAATEVPTAETESTVPELITFHDVIYEIWHTAYPAKDVAMLRSMVKDVDAGAAKVVNAPLPGILRDKEAKWQEGITEFKKTVEAYDTAAAGKDDQALLDAAEALHANFEMLVRIIRPVTKEVDAFHKELYIVYHKYLPEKKLDDIKKASAVLLAKAEAIKPESLSPRLQAKSEAFKSAAATLLDECKKLVEITQKGTEEEISKGVDIVHTAYQALEQVFD